MLKSLSPTGNVTRAALLALLLGAASVQAAEAQPAKSLYDRLGGVYPISVVVDTFIELLLVNDVQTPPSMKPESAFLQPG
jgi:hemoglobin